MKYKDELEEILKVVDDLADKHGTEYYKMMDIGSLRLKVVRSRQVAALLHFLILLSHDEVPAD